MTSNVVKFPSITVDANPYYLGVRPKGFFPIGTVPIKTVKVSMAVGMYQFHDLLSQHGTVKTKEKLSFLNL
jgi:hypothetical protein